MDPRTIARFAGLLGGLCWAGRLLVDAGAADDALHGGGLLLLTVAFAAFGAGLVSSGAAWLRALVAVALPLLVWSVLEALHPAGDPEVVDGVVGVVVGLGAAVLLVRRLGRSRSTGGRSRSVGAPPERRPDPPRDRRAAPPAHRTVPPAHPHRRSSGSHAR
jgi:hypothetical protein